MENQPADKFQVPVQTQTFIASSPTPMQPASGMPKFKIDPKIALMGFVVFLLIALPIGAYFLGQQQGQAIRSAKLAAQMNSFNVTPIPQVSTPTPTPTAVPTPTIATNSGTLVATDTATWKTYTNTKYNFSIKYPVSWINQEYSDGTGTNFASSAASLQSPTVNIRTIAKPTSHLNDSFVNYVPIAAIQELQGYSKLVSNEPVTTTSGLTGYETTWTTTANGQSNQSQPITYFQIPNNNAATIEIFLNKQEELDTYQQMLSTFQFNQ